MRLTRLRIRDIGRHKSLDQEIDVAVLGLIGPNGTGKTTLLECLDFAFTGKLQDAQETYVRNAFRPDPPDGEKDPLKPTNGDVTLWFRKDNKEGEIYRRVGKSPKRHLIWEGVKYTSAADIEAKLKELFEADKDAMSNAVFPPQGSLDKLLFGTQAERADLFTKLLLIGYTNKIVDYADQEIAMLLDQVQDYTSLLVEIKTQHSLAEDELAKLEGNHARSYDWNADYQHYRDYLRVTAELSFSDTRKKELEQQVATHRLNMEKTVAQMGQVLGLAHPSLEMVLEEIETIDTEISELQKKIEVQNRTERLRNQKIKADARLLEVRSKIKELQERLQNHKDQTENIQTVSQRIQAQRQRQALLVKLHDTLLPQKEAIDKDLQKWQAEVDNLPTTEELQKLSEEAERAEKLANLAEGKVEALQALVNAGDDDGLCCPVCGTGATGHGHDWMVRLHIARQEFAPLREAADTAKWNYHGSSRRLTQLNALKEKLDKSSEENQREIELHQEAISKFPDEDLEALEFELKQLEADQSRTAGIQENINILAQEQETLEGVINAITPTDMLAVLQFDENLTVVLSHDLAHAKNKREDVRLGNQDDKVIALVRSAEQSITQCDIDLCQLADTRKDLVEELTSLHAGLSPHTLQLMEETGSDKPRILSILQERALAYNEMTGAVKQAREQANKLQKRRDEIEQQIEKDQLRQNVVSELKTLRNAFVRKAIPQVYMQYIFESLTPMAQENLNTLGADFVIEPDPESPVTVRFMKLTEDGSGWMPQSKMSGGQKVRVSIAFLLAIQQLVIPDISFLVLDEPSTHVDDDGIEAMKDLFSTLGEQLQHTEAQIIVCDHKPELQASFNKTIKLS